VTGVSRPGAPRPVTPNSILAAELEQLAGALDAVPGLDEGWRERLRGACALAGGLDPYVSRCTSPESPALRGLAEATAAEDWRRHGDGPAPAPLEQEMLSGHVEGRLLQMLVQVTRARRVLDIGMFTGYSALAMAEALPADATVVACEIDPDVAAFARERFAASADGHKIDVRVGPAERTLAELAADAPFDLVFLDADKAGYVAYFTVESNFLVLVTTARLSRDPAYDGPRWRVLRVAAVSGITVSLSASSDGTHGPRLANRAAVAEKRSRAAVRAAFRRAGPVTVRSSNPSSCRRRLPLRARALRS